MYEDVEALLSKELSNKDFLTVQLQCWMLKKFVFIQAIRIKSLNIQHKKKIPWGVIKDNDAKQIPVKSLKCSSPNDLNQTMGFYQEKTKFVPAERNFKLAWTRES
ncbi:hypothetical protein BpHYR1_007132 [Brachionus plicatilis]|uniref:Uncharacterized protein n=1 Tax=Brachionus plicatilis TaxID=10195 RepID=A0A3M7T6Y0_BRAPC|nr:hypothetical protein BpHYR1_007132 [Brachionus plicatilis]